MAGLIFSFNNFIDGKGKAKIDIFKQYLQHLTFYLLVILDSIY